MPVRDHSEESAPAHSLLISCPAWTAGTAWADVDGELVVWSDRGAFTVRAPVSAAFQFLDGQVALGELATDLGAVLGIPDGEAYALLSTAALELAGHGLVTGIELPERLPTGTPDTLHDALGDRSASSTAPTTRDVSGRHHIGDSSASADPSTSAVTGSPDPLGIETTVDGEGRTVTIEHLPDGRRRMTTTVSIELPAGAVSLDAILGERSAVELVPADSCLGTKVRSGDDLPMVAVTCRDGVVRRVRCQDPDIASEIARRAGPNIVTADAPGPVEAIVVAPYEGSGPCRVFDGRGRRRGRARTVTEVANLVEQLLGEATTATEMARSHGAQLNRDEAPRHQLMPAPAATTAAGPCPHPLPLTWHAVTGPAGQSWLVPDWMIEGRRRRELDAAGLTVQWGTVDLHPDGSVRHAVPHGDGAPVGTDAILRPEAPAMSLADRVRELAASTPVPVLARADALARLEVLAASRPWEAAASTLNLHPPSER